jgi:hypothetical protein
MDESERPFTAASSGELEAIHRCNKIFDKWLRNMYSAQSARLPPPRRAVLLNGQ